MYPYSVIGMLGSLLILLLMPVLDTSRLRGSQFRPLMRAAFWVFVTIFFLLMYIGSQHAEEPFITIGAIATVLYFGWFLVLVPVIGVIENTLMDIATSDNTPSKNTPSQSVILRREYSTIYTILEKKMLINHFV